MGARLEEQALYNKAFAELTDPLRVPKKAVDGDEEKRMEQNCSL